MGRVFRLCPTLAYPCLPNMETPTTPISHGARQGSSGSGPWMNQTGCRVVAAVNHLSPSASHRVCSFEHATWNL